MLVTIPLDFLAKKLNINAAEFAETFKIGEGEEALSAKSLKELESKFNSIFESKYNEGKTDEAGESLRKGLDKREKAFAEKYGIKRATFDVMGERLVESIKESNKNLDPNDVRASEVYKNDFEEWKNKHTTLEGELSRTKADHEWQKVESRALEQFKTKMKDEGFDISNDALVKVVFKQTISGDKKPLIGDQDNLIMADADGKVVRLNGAAALTYDDHALSIGGPLLPKDNAPPKTQGGGTVQGKPNTYKFSNFDEANEAIKNAETKEEEDRIIAAAKEQLD